MVTIGFGVRLSLEDVEAVAYGARVALSARTRQILKRRRSEIERFLKQNPQPAYGFNRGFGHNVDNSVSPELLSDLQRNLIRSHASGVGPLAPREVVRATMLLRAHSLAQGHSAVRSEVVELIVAFLNRGITPPSLSMVR